MKTTEKRRELVNMVKEILLSKGEEKKNSLLAAKVAVKMGKKKLDKEVISIVRQARAELAYAKEARETILNFCQKNRDFSRSPYKLADAVFRTEHPHCPFSAIRAEAKALLTEWEKDLKIFGKDWRQRVNHAKDILEEENSVAKTNELYAVRFDDNPLLRQKVFRMALRELERDASDFKARVSQIKIPSPPSGEGKKKKKIKKKKRRQRDAKIRNNVLRMF